MNHKDVQLNMIGDAAAADMQEFYQQQLDEDVQGRARYEAHLYLGLLAWRAGDQKTMESHLPAAASIAAGRFVERSDEQSGSSISPFDFMIPAFLVYVFGSQEDRAELSQVRRAAWAGRGDEEFASVTELLDLIASNAASLEFNRAHIECVLRLNNSSKTHRFYQPWINAFCEGLLAALDHNKEDVNHACTQLRELHEEQALEGEWQLRLESIIDFWTSALVVTAKHYKLPITANSPYVPQF
jgi:hypothetical protein